MSTLSVKVISDVTSLGYVDSSLAAANSASGAAFNQSNLAYNTANSAFNAANNVNLGPAFNAANAAYNTANAAFGTANTSLQNTSFTLNGTLTVGTIKANVIQTSGGTNVFANGIPQRSGSVIEYISSPCDGSTVVGISGSYTFQNVTAQQSDSYSYVDLTGSSITYTPPAGATRVIYRFEWASYWGSAHSISHNKFFIDGVEVLYARHSRSAYYHESRSQFEWTIHIGGNAWTNTGRQATWTTGKVMKIQYRSYGGRSEEHTSELQSH